MIGSSTRETVLRHAYFDEAGVGDEPYTIVAGFLMHIDDQYRSLQKYILDMADDLVGKDRPGNFHFHAKDLWHGGRFFPREKWPRAKRHEILGYLAEIPEKFSFPVIYACVSKKEEPARDESRQARAAALRRRHLICFLSCLSQTDRYIKKYCEGEMAFVVVEDHADHRSILRDASRVMADPRSVPAIMGDPEIGWKPHTSLLEDPLFQGKSLTSPLQVADACAFILNKHLGEDPYALPHVEKFKNSLIFGLKKDFVKRKKPFVSSSPEQSS